MKIREFKIDDYPIVRDLWQAAGLILRPGDELEDAKLKLQRDSDLFLVAIQDDMIVGSVMGGWDGRGVGKYNFGGELENQGREFERGLVAEAENGLKQKGPRRGKVKFTNGKEEQASSLK